MRKSQRYNQSPHSRYNCVLLLSFIALFSFLCCLMMQSAGWKVKLHKRGAAARPGAKKASASEVDKTKPGSPQYSALPAKKIFEPVCQGGCLTKLSLPFTEKREFVKVGDTLLHVLPCTTAWDEECELLKIVFRFHYTVYINCFVLSLVYVCWQAHPILLYGGCISERENKLMNPASKIFIYTIHWLLVNLKYTSTLLPS